MTRRYPAGPQRLLRSLNGRAVLEAIDEAGPVTTTDLAGRITLSRPTVAAAVALLLDRGVITEVGPAIGRKGPAPAQYRVNADCAFAIGVDVGHRKIRAAVADVTGRVRGRAESEQQGHRGADALVAQILDMCVDLAGQVGRPLAASPRSWRDCRPPSAPTDGICRTPPDFPTRGGGSAPHSAGRSRCRWSWRTT